MIIIARHGKTEWNEEGRLQGRLNSPLNRVGISQATSLGKTVRDLIPDPIVYSSNSQRCVETLEYASLKENAVLMAELQECNFGLMEGMHYLKAEKIWADYYEVRERDWETKWLLPAPGGESYSDVYQRITDALGWIKNDSLDQDVLIMTHGFTSRVVRGILLDRTPKEILSSPKQANNEIFVIKKTKEKSIAFY